ncbi:MAG: hypothetical protein IT576_03890 [Verrucomicrobiales bacterium]|nr:hypothetical protein [Verrucomicrobiales bacterium]
MSQHSSRGGQQGNRDGKSNNNNRSRGGRRRTRKPTNGEGDGGDRGPRDSRASFRPSKGRPAPKPTFFERLLSVLTFGLLGKKAAPAPAPRKDRGPREDREPREDRAPREDRGPRENRENREPRGDRPQRQDRERSESGSGPRRERFGDEPARAPREPRQVDVTSPRLYVGNLDYEATEADLEELFRGVGAVVTAEIVTNQRNQTSKGFGFVEMSHIDEARRAVQILHDKDFMGRKLLVTGAKSAGPGDDTEVEQEAAAS